MKKVYVLGVLAMTAMMICSAAFAGTTQGTIQSVDITTKKIEVKSEAGVASLSFGDTTQWPEGVTDPSSLVGKSVTITTDEAGQEAASVALEAVAAQ